MNPLGGGGVLGKVLSGPNGPALEITAAVWTDVMQRINDAV